LLPRLRASAHRHSARRTAAQALELKTAFYSLNPPFAQCTSFGTTQTAPGLRGTLARSHFQCSYPMTGTAIERRSFGGLTGCNTMQGAGKDVERGGEKIQKEAIEHKNY